MISSFLMNAAVDVIRRGTYTPGAPTTTYDEWTEPAYGEDAVVASVRGRIRPLSIREQQALSDAAPTTGEYRGYLPRGTDVAIGDRVRKSTGETFEVRGVTPDPAGTDRYVLLELSQVVP